MLVKGIDVFDNKAVELTLKEGVVIGKKYIPSEPNLPFISPGFFDIQVNGYQGIDYSGTDLSIADIERLIYLLAASGTTRHIPTIITNSQEKICKNLAVIADAVKQNALVAQAIPGVHIEGPYISHLDGPRGAHDLDFVRNPSVSELDEWIAASRGLLRMVTLAPEREGSIEFIQAARAKGILISIGHTAAEPEVIQKAIAAGAELSTHLGNGSHAQLPRLRNYLWEQLASETLWAGIIADGYHLPPSVLRVIYKTKGLDRLILVSDVAFLGGYAPGNYNWGNISVDVHPDGHLALAGTPFLAGAGHLLDTCIPHFATTVNIGIGEAIALATHNPDKLLGTENKKLGLDKGQSANLTLFTWPDPQSPLKVQRTLLGGKELFRE